MFPLFETICVVDAKVLHAEWHEERFKHSYKRLFSKEPPFSLFEGVVVPEDLQEGKCKLRILYNAQTKSVECTPYKALVINSIKLVATSNLMYDLKYTDRTALHDLLAKKEACDDVLIEHNAYLSDTSFSNLVFFDGKDWLTPSTPLLNGTARQRLLASGQIKEKKIRRSDLKGFISFQLINAMRDLHEYDTIPIEQIF